MLEGKRERRGILGEMPEMCKMGNGKKKRGSVKEGMEKMGFFKKLEKNRVLQLVVFCALEVVILGSYFVGGKWVDKQGEKERLSKQGIKVDYNILAQIDNLSMQENDIFLEGWILRLQSKKTNSYIVLKEVGGTESLVYDMKTVLRNDVEAKFGGDWDYEKSGFEVEIPIKKVNDKACYEIQLGISYVVDEKDEKLTKISTNRYLYNGEMFSYNPLTFEEPKINDEEIVEVVNKGVLYVHSSKKNIWIYDFNGKMYWILDSKYVPELEDAPAIPWTLFTNRGDLAPKDEVKVREGETYVHYSIYLKGSDLVEGDGTDYFIVSREIPKEFPITYMRTGSWSSVDSWIYRAEIPVYEIDRK